MNNNTPDPVAIARSVLDAVKVMDATPGTLYLDGPTHEHEKAASSILDAAPDLARAVIAVAELHEPDHTYPDCPKCIHCSEMASTGTRRIAVLWPCDTVTAITTARDGIR